MLAPSPQHRSADEHSRADVSWYVLALNVPILSIEANQLAGCCELFTDKYAHAQKACQCMPASGGA